MIGGIQGFLWFLFVFGSDSASLGDSSSKVHYACKTVGGMSRNKACIFPFTNPYNGATHYACTHDHGLPAWCATRVNSDGKMSGAGYLGFCGSDCEVEKYATCYASLSRTSMVTWGKFSTCVFPFIHEEKEYSGCAPYNRGSNSYPENSDTPICATAVDGDGKLVDWGYCLSDCPDAGPANLSVGALDGKGRGRRCVFPFHDDGVWNVKCRPESGAGSREYCATELKENGAMETDQFGYCTKEDSTNCITVGGSKWGQACRFPFRTPWSQELHWNCTTDLLPEAKGSSDIYPSAPWCATNTDAADKMGEADWGYCSKSCPTEKQNFCYADTGTSLNGLKRCIFPFIFNGQKYYRCTEHNGHMKCATKVNSQGVANANDMMKCTNSEECSVKETVNGSPVSIGYIDVASYTNKGSSCLQIFFEYTTGIEDSTESNWNVEASVSAEFSYLGAEFGASLTAGGGGGSSNSGSSGTTHSLTYLVGPFTRVTLKQMIAKAGNFQAHTFKIQLVEMSLKTNKVINGTIHGEKNANGTAVQGQNPCTKFDDFVGSGDDEDGDDGDEDDDEDEEEEECSNEKYGEKDKDGKKNENCSTDSQEEADAEEEKEKDEEDEEENKKRSTTTVRSTSEENDEDEEEQDDKRTTKKKNG